MDSVVEVLISWGIPQEIINNFIANGITIEHFSIDTGVSKRTLSTFEYKVNIAGKKFRINFVTVVHSRDIFWLNSNSEPWDEVMIKWKTTFEFRKESEHKSVLNDFLQDWKILSDPRSDVLINIDFDMLYPKKGLNIFLNWYIFFEQLIKLKSIQDEGIQNLIDSLRNIDDELKISTQIKILGKLVPPKGRLNKKIKFTTQEAIESLFICVSNAGDIDEAIKQQKEKAQTKKL